MSTSLPFTVIELVIRALGHDVAPERRDAELRREPDECASRRSAREAVLAAGRRHDVAFLARDLTRGELAQLVADGALPLALLGGVDGAPEAIVLAGRRGALAHGQRVARDGGCTPVAGPPDEVAALALLAAPAATVLALVPVLTTPTLGAARPLLASLRPGEREEDAPVRAPTPLERLFALLSRERRDIGLIYLYAALAGVFGLTLPLGVQMIVGLVSGGLILQPVVLLIAFVVVGTVVTGALQVMQLGIVELIQQRVFARLAFEFAARLPRVHAERAREEDLPEVMNRFFEIKTIQKSLVKLLTDGVTAMLQVVLGLVLLSFYHPYFTLFGAGLVAGVALLVRLSGPKGLETSLLESKYKYRVLHWLEEMARTVSTFRFAARSELPVARMDAEVTGYLKYRKKHFAVLLMQSWAAIAFKTVITGGVLVLGSVLVIDRQITLGQFVASEIVIVTVLIGIEKLVLSLADVYDILASVHKAGYVTDLPLDRAGGHPVPDVAARGGVEIAAVGLSYRYAPNAERALDGVSLVVRPGEKVAITGAEGAGESTLLNVLAGMYEGYEGALAYNGLSARDVDRAALRALVGRASHDVELFEGTVEENVAVGRADVRTADVIRAIERVGLAGWMHALPDGLQARVGGARHVHAAVARRLVLARCIAGRPAILALDAYFDALEPAVKRQVIDVVCAPDAPWSVVAVTHDPALLAACDRILLLRDGRVVREGSYASLRSDDYFRTVVPPVEALVRA